MTLWFCMDKVGVFAEPKYTAATFRLAVGNTRGVAEVRGLDANNVSVPTSAGPISGWVLRTNNAPLLT